MRKDKVNAVYAWISCIIDIGCIQVLAEMIFMHFNDSWYLDLVVCLCYVCVVCVFLLIIIIIYFLFFMYNFVILFIISLLLVLLSFIIIIYFIYYYYYFFFCLFVLFCFGLRFGGFWISEDIILSFGRTFGPHSWNLFHMWQKYG